MKKILILIFVICACASSKWGGTWLSQLSDWQKESPEKNYSIQPDLTVTRKSVPSLRFEIRHTEGYETPNSFTFRSQISTNVFPEKYSEKFYACSILLPRQFPQENNRLVLMEWWPKTKKKLGEVGRNPSLSLSYVNGLLHAIIRHSDVLVIHKPEAVPSVTLFKTSHFPLGVWNDFLFQVKWSPKKDGQVTMWWNGKEVGNYNGPVGYDDLEAPLFKFGLYRDDSELTYVAFFSECRMGNNLRDVQPKQ
ncbi:MAG: heparin lyase I family protein [Bacteriovoracaceae bacterium]